MLANYEYVCLGAYTSQNPDDLSRSVPPSLFLSFCPPLSLCMCVRVCVRLCLCDTHTHTYSCSSSTLLISHTPQTIGTTVRHCVMVDATLRIPDPVVHVCFWLMKSTHVDAISKPRPHHADFGCPDKSWRVAGNLVDMKAVAKGVQFRSRARTNPTIKLMVSITRTMNSLVHSSLTPYNPWRPHSAIRLCRISVNLDSTFSTFLWRISKTLKL
jgi:hypothetical protein